MAKNKTSSKKVVQKKKQAVLSDVVPVPPAGEEKVRLNVEVSSKVGWRLKLSLVQLEALGKKTHKYQFVEDALTLAIAQVDQLWGEENGS